MPSRTDRINDLFKAPQKKKINRGKTQYNYFDYIKDLYINRYYNTQQINEIVEIFYNVDRRKNIFKDAVKKLKIDYEAYNRTNTENILDSHEIKITSNNIFPNGQFQWWIHANEIQEMMKKYPNNLIKHEVFFYNTQNSLSNAYSTITINFEKKMNRKRINDKLKNKVYDESSGNWIVEAFLIDFIDDMINNNKFVIIKTTAYRQFINNATNRLNQTFQENINKDCVYDSLIKFFSKIDNKHGKTIYNKLVNNKNIYSKGYTIDELEKLGQDLKISFTITDLLDDTNDIIINPHKENIYNVKLVNSRYNHVDLLTTTQDFDIVKIDDYNKIKSESNFYVEKYNFLITLKGNYKLEDSEFKIIFDEWKEENKYNKLSIPINSDCYKFIDSYDCKYHRFFNINMEVDDNLYNEIDLKNAYYNFDKCTYYAGIPSSSYICVNGDGLTTEMFLEQYKNKLIGYYEVIINHNNNNLCILGIKNNSKHILFSSMIKLLLNYDVKFTFINYCIAPTVDIKFNETHKKTVFKNKIYDEGTKGLGRGATKIYCKIIGSLEIESEQTIYKVKPDMNDLDYYKTLNHECVFINDEFNVFKPILEPHSHRHIATSIKSYVHTIILEQMLKMDCNNIFGVKVDCIVFKKDYIFDYNKDLFKAPTQSKISKMCQRGGFGLDHGLDDENENHSSFYIKYFIEPDNNIIFEKSFLPDNKHILNRVLFLGGAGGAGKTHSTLKSNIFIKNKMVYSSFCWELIQSKITEFNVLGLSIPKILGDNLTGDNLTVGFTKSDISHHPEELRKELEEVQKIFKSKIITSDIFNQKNFKYKINFDELADAEEKKAGKEEKKAGKVKKPKKSLIINTDGYKYLMVDELTLLNNDTINKIIDKYKNMFVILAGDIRQDGFYFQCSITNDIFKPSADKCQYVEYIKTYRFNEELNEKIIKLRDERTKTNNPYILYNKFKKLFNDNIKDKKDVIFNSNDVGISCIQPIDAAGNCKFSDEFFNNGSAKQYYYNKTNYGALKFKGALCEENEPGAVCSLFRTIHSYQGRQLTHENNIIILLNNIGFDINLLYTAVSRARRVEQIIIIEDFNERDKKYLSMF